MRDQELTIPNTRLMNFTFISPRLTKKNDLFGSGIPYWPLETINFVSWLEAKHNYINCTIIDLFSENINKIESEDDQIFIGDDIASGHFDEKNQIC